MEGVALVVEAHRVVKIAEGGFGPFGVLTAPMHVEADAEATEHAEHPDGVAMAHAAAVFLGRDIQPLMQPIFDAPALAVELQPAGGVEPLRRRAAEQVHGFRLPRAHLAVQHGRLRRGRKANLLRADCLALQRAGFLPALILFLGLHPGDGGRGGPPRRLRQRDRCRGEGLPARAAAFAKWRAGWAGCL